MAGLATAFGSGAMTNSIAEIEDADVILAIGTNTTENHPVIGSVVRRAVTRKGAKLIVADPRQIGLVQDAALWLRQRPGTDVALLNGMMYVILKEGLENREFIAQRTEGFDQLAKVVKKYNPARVEKITGVPAADIEAAARMYATAQRATILYAMGITQHTSGTDNVMSLANLAMLCGQIGRPSTGVNPLRGQNNVQGACDLGGLPNVLTGYQKVTDKAVRDRFARAWGVKRLPAKVGLTLSEMIAAAHEGKLKALYIMGENPMVSDPDTGHVAEALDKLEFLVVQDIFLTETAAKADVVLPAACWAETDGTFTNTERRVQLVRKAVDAPGQARPDWRILVDLGRRLGLEMRYASPKQVFSEIAELTPSYRGITYARLERLGGLQWPCPDRRHPGTPILHVDGFARGKGLFQAIEYRQPAERPSKQYPLVLTTGRLLYHYHTTTMTRRSPGLPELAGECQVEVNPADAQELGLSDGAKVRITSRRGSIEAVAWVTPRVAPGVVFLPFHYAEAAANRLTNTALDPVAKIPELKVCAVRLERA